MGARNKQILDSQVGLFSGRNVSFWWVLDGMVGHGCLGGGWGDGMVGGMVGWSKETNMNTTNANAPF